MKVSIRIISLFTLASILLLTGCGNGSAERQVADAPTDVSDPANSEISPSDESIEDSPSDEDTGTSLPEEPSGTVDAELTIDFNSTTYVGGDTSFASGGAFNNINIQVGEEVNITGTLTEDSGEKELMLTGKLYPFNTGIYTDRIIVGDFVSENDDFAVRRIAVDSEYHDFDDETQNENVNPQTPFISIYLDNNSTGDIIYLQTNITQENYDKLLEVSQRNMSEYFTEGNTTDEYNKKVVRLYLGRILDGREELLDIYLSVCLREEE